MTTKSQNEDTAKRDPNQGSPPRRRAREFAMQGLYQHLVGGQEYSLIEEHAASIIGFHKCDTTLYKSLLATVIEKKAELITLITPHLDRAWERVSPVEQAILLLGICEVLYFPITAHQIVINEAIEIAKDFGGTDGHKFVNGVLDKLVQAMRTANVDT